MITTVHRTPVQQPAYKPVIEQFWSPVLASQQPVVICLGASSLRPMGSHVQDPGGNTNTYLGAPVRDVYAAITISKLLDKIGKPSEVRVETRHHPSMISAAPRRSQWAPTTIN